MLNLVVIQVNTNPPNDTGYIEGTPMPQVIYLDKVNLTCLVRISPKRSVVAHLKNKAMAEAIQLLDYVDLKWSHVTKQWNVVMYYVNSEVTEEIHETYQAVLI